MITSKWDPLSEFVCFNSLALGVFEEKFALFQAIIEHPITETLISDRGLEMAKEALNTFINGYEDPLRARNNVRDTYIWN